MVVVCRPFSGLVLLIEGSKLAFFCRRIRCHVKFMTLDAPKKSATYEGKFGSFNEKDDVCPFSIGIQEARGSAGAGGPPTRTNSERLKAKHD